MASEVARWERPKLSELVAFAKIAETKNFSRASARLGIAAPTISRSLKTLETRLGIELLKRTTHEVQLTEVGAILFERLGPALSDVEAAVQCVYEYKQRSDRSVLRLGLSGLASLYFSSALAVSFSDLLGSAAIDLVPSSGIENFDRSNLDAVIALGTRAVPRFEIHAFGPSFPLMAVASPSLGRGTSLIEPSEVNVSKTVRWSPDIGGATDIWHFTRDSVRITVLPPTGGLVTADAAIFLTALQHGAGVGVTIYPHVKEALRNKRLIRAFSGWDLPVARFSLFVPVGKASLPSTRALTANGLARALNTSVAFFFADDECLADVIRCFSQLSPEAQNVILKNIRSLMLSDATMLPNDRLSAE